MFKYQKLKTYIKKYPEIFNRIITGYKLNQNNSLLSKTIEYLNETGVLRINIEDGIIQIYKKEYLKISKERIKFKKDTNEIISNETVISSHDTGKSIEKIQRRYQIINKKVKLVSLKAIHKFKSNRDFKENKTTIHLEDNKIVVNGKDISLLLEKDNKRSIEERYNKYKSFLNTSHEETIQSVSESLPKSKSQKQISLENKLRKYLKERLNYKAPLENRDLYDLVRIIKMISRRNKTSIEVVKQYKKAA